MQIHTVSGLTLDLAPCQFYRGFRHGEMPKEPALMRVQTITDEHETRHVLMPFHEGRTSDPVVLLAPSTEEAERTFTDTGARELWQKEPPTPVFWMPGAYSLPQVERVEIEDYNEFRKILRKILRQRTGRDWSVSRGKGTAYGWCTIDAPPARCLYSWDGNEACGHYPSVEDRALLAAALQLPGIVHPQGESVPASTAHRREYLNRATGHDWVTAEQYWD